MSHSDRPQSTRRVSGPPNSSVFSPIFHGIFPVASRLWPLVTAFFLTESVFARRRVSQSSHTLRSNLHRASVWDTPGFGAVQRGS
jgi:hypothetical protein